MSSPRQVVVSGGFDDIKSRDLRFLEEAAKLGEVSVLLWPDETLQRLGIEYLVLKRTPAPALPQRSSTVLRGF
jgi:glycerol-3-phosphate cytidylyltransferase-like family protein